jgi:flavin-dependent dehydrogenase
MSAIDAIVVGGGPAGASAAARLAAAGRRVVLVERESGPHHKVCGEFVSAEAARYIAGLGVDLAALGAAPIDAVRLVSGSRVATARLPFPAFGLSRRRLDEALLARAGALGAALRRGIAVRAVEPHGAGVRVRLDGETLEAPSVFLATGKHDLRGWVRRESADDDLIGFKMHFALAPAQAASLRGHVELVLFAGGYAGLQLVEDGDANLCLLLRRGRFRRFGRRWPDLLAHLLDSCPHLAERLAGSTPRWHRPLAIFRLPYGYLDRRGAGDDIWRDRVWRLGDQAAVTPSFTGDGMAMALHGARLAAETALAGGGAAAYRRRLAADLARPIARAVAIARPLAVPALQPFAVAAARLCPALLAAAAAVTRVPV